MFVGGIRARLVCKVVVQAIKLSYIEVFLSIFRDRILTTEVESL